MQNILKIINDNIITTNENVIDMSKKLDDLMDLKVKLESFLEAFEQPCEEIVAETKTT